MSCHPMAMAQDALIQVQWHFGQLIANTDMHDGNLSIVPGPGRAVATAAGAKGVWRVKDRKGPAGAGSRLGPGAAVRCG